MSGYLEKEQTPVDEKETETEALSGKTVRGMMWTFAEMFGRYGVTWVITIYLARLLTPADYGIVGLTMAFLMIASMIVDGGFKSVLIRKKSVTPADYNTAFMTNIALSLLIYAIIYICAPYIARFTGEPQLTHIIRLLGITLITNAMTIVQNIELRRTMRFGLLAFITVPAEILSGAVAIWMAYNGFGVMSLAAKILLSSVTAMILYRCIVRWRPKFEFCAKSFRELLKIGGGLTLANVLWVICANISAILIGRIFTALHLGYYSFSDRIVNMASNNITLAVQQVSFTSFSKIQHDNQRLLGAQKQVVQSAAAIIFPMMTALAIMAKPLFALFLNESWMPAIPYLRMLCVCGALTSVYTITNDVLLVKCARHYLKIDYTAVIILAVMIFTLLPLGVNVFLIGQAVHMLILIAVIEYFKSRLMNYRFGTLFVHIAPVAVSSAVMGGAIYFAMKLFHNTGFIQCAVSGAAALITYCLCMRILRVEAFMRLVNSVRRV